MATEFGRREFLSRVGALLAAACGRIESANSSALSAGPEKRQSWPELVCSWEDDTVHYAGVWSPLRGARGIALPARAHGVLADPLNGDYAIAVARRPGDYIVRFNTHLDGDARFERPGTDRVFNGHAIFSPDAKTLFTSENRAGDGIGVVGVRDATTLRKHGEFETHGIGPHALLVESADTLLVANGGILTLPETGRIKLDPEHMDSSLVRLDMRDGRLLGQWRLTDSRLSIRHMARSKDESCVGIALQAEHADKEQRERAPVLALFDGKSLRPTSAPAETRLAGYGGDVACVARGAATHFAVSCTYAGSIAIWDQHGEWIGTVPMRNACALTQRDDELIAASEDGELAMVLPRQSEALIADASPLKWDNHIVVYRQGTG